MRTSMSMMVVALACLIGGNCYSQGLDHWKAVHRDILFQEFVCKPTEPLNDRSPCNYLVSNVLIEGWGLPDFGGKGEYISANQIFDYVDLSENWVEIGSGDEQATLDLAQQYANQGYPIIAVSKGAAHGHVAFVIPGEATHSGSWNLKAPNSASFFLDKPHKAYVGKMLSFAWSSKNKSKVTVFARKYCGPGEKTCAACDFRPVCN